MKQASEPRTDVQYPKYGPLGSIIGPDCDETTVNKCPLDQNKPDLSYVHGHVSSNKGTMHTHGNMRLTSKNKCDKRMATNTDLTSLMCTDMGHVSTRCHVAVLSSSSITNLCVALNH